MKKNDVKHGGRGSNAIGYHHMLGQEGILKN